MRTIVKDLKAQMGVASMVAIHGDDLVFAAPVRELLRIIVKADGRHAEDILRFVEGKWSKPRKTPLDAGVMERCASGAAMDSEVATAYREMAAILNDLAV